MSKTPRIARTKRAARAVANGDVLARVVPWTITCNDPGYSMLIQFQNGEQRFTTHYGAQALVLAIMEALRVDPARQDGGEE